MKRENLKMRVLIRGVVPIAIGIGVAMAGVRCGTGSGGGGGGGNVNAPPANVNVNSNVNANPNANTVAGNQNANVNSGGATIPEQFRGSWSFMGDCGAFDADVDATGRLMMTTSVNCVSGDGTVQADGSFQLAVLCNFNPGGGGGAVICGSMLTGQLDPANISSGSGSRECVGDPTSSPCAFTVARGM